MVLEIQTKALCVLHKQLTIVLDPQPVSFLSQGLTWLHKQALILVASQLNLPGLHTIHNKFLLERTDSKETSQWLEG